MFDLDGFLTLLDEAERQRRPSSRSSSVAVDRNAGLKPKRGRPTVVVGDAGLPRGGRPWTGSTPQPVPFEDEVRKRRGGSPAGRRAVAGGRSKGVEGRAGGGEFGPFPASAKSRLSIASGSQPAVVKLISFAAGGSRVQKLLGYQSRGGELPVENEAGDTLTGGDWIKALANEWAEDDGRKPSKDVLRLSLSVRAQQFSSDEEVVEALKMALPGHRIAWSIHAGGENEMRRVDLVMSAARRRQPGEERAGRVYDNRKSLRDLNARLKGAFGDNAVIELHGFAHGVEGVARYLGQVHKGGRHVVTAARMDKAGAFVADRLLEGDRPFLDEAKDWKRDLRSQERRDVAHIVLSAKPGTPKDAFVAAARAMLAREFSNHRYLFTLHEDRTHLHVHAVVKMLSETGQRLHPKIEDLRRWRTVLAEEARERNIPMDAVSRFERANPPGFKMKDIRRVERGEASESVRRRVEAVRGQVLHVPIRPEGLKHAMATATAWSGPGAVGDHDLQEPPMRPGVVRLYRAERQDSRSSAPLFTRDRVFAAQIAIRDGATLRYLDVSEAEVRSFTPSRQHPETMVVVPRDMAARSEAIGVAAPELIDRFRGRAVEALMLGEMAAAQRGIVEHGTPRRMGKEPEMADFEVMTSAFADMETNLDTIGKSLPPERLQEFGGLRKKLKASQAQMLQAQTEIEKKRGRIEGETFVQPVPRDFAAFVAEKRGEDVRYSHRGPDGRVGATAFSDHGDRVEVSNWRDRETVLAALQLGAEKWGAVRVNGTDKYKRLAVELAAEHGFQLTNPELQEQLAAARDRIARERPERASVMAGTMETQKGMQQRDDDVRRSEVTLDLQTSVPAGNTHGKPAGSAPKDTGDRIKPGGEDRASMLAAMQEAAKKWDSIAVIGSDRQKAIAIELAAEHGFRISNPELQEKLAEARQKVGEGRVKDQARGKASAVFADGSSGEKAPVDTGDKVKPADRDRASMLTAMRAASEKWGTIAVNGSERDKTIAVEIAAEHGFRISNPELQDKLLAAREKVEERRQKELARERKQPGFVDGTNSSQEVRRSDAEISIALETVKEKTEAEAHREVRQARQTTATRERPIDGGGEDHAYRTKAEASAALRAEKSVEQDPSKPMPVDVNQSPEIERQRLDQKKLLSEMEANSQEKVQRQRQKPKQKQ